MLICWPPALQFSPCKVGSFAKRARQKKIKSSLEGKGFYDTGQKIASFGECKVLIPLMDEAVLLLAGEHEIFTSPATKQYCNFVVPKRYELYANFLLLPAACTESNFEKLALHFNVQVVAKKGCLDPTDEMRSPKVQILYDVRSCKELALWTSIKQNLIIYHWQPQWTMFSQGNISEKLRMSTVCCEGQVVLDLYAGIGYFTLIFLVHGNATKVIAIDMNYRSIEALQRNIKENKIPQGKCEVYCGRNEHFVEHYAKKCHRVCLGLIPSSEKGWHLATQALVTTGGTLHIHQNVEKEKLAEFIVYMLKKLEEISIFSATLLHAECVKSYAPKVFHYVFDVRLAA